MNPWLGADRGFLTDWITQRWVRVTGRRVALADAPWLRGPVAAPTGVADDEFDRYAARERLAAQPESDDHGMLEDFGALRSQRFDPARIRPEVVDFYERTARYRLHLWSQWSPAFAPFGRAVDRIFARRLGQLQLPLAPLDTRGGIESRVIRLQGDGRTETAWLRRLRPGGEVLYAGLYAIARPPLAAGPCVKVAFPLPNGNASVFLDPVARPDGSLELVSSARSFGAAGFYFGVVRDDATVWVPRPAPRGAHPRVLRRAGRGPHRPPVLALGPRVPTAALPLRTVALRPSCRVPSFSVWWATRERARPPSRAGWSASSATATSRT